MPFLSNYLIFDKQFITYIVILYNHSSFIEIKNLHWSWPLTDKYCNKIPRNNQFSNIQKQTEIQETGYKTTIVKGETIASSPQ